MTWWQKTLSGLIVGAVLVAAGYVLRMWTAPTPTVKTEYIHDTTHVPAALAPAHPPAYAHKPGTPFDSTTWLAARDSLSRVLAAHLDSIAAKNEFILKLVRPKFGTQRMRIDAPERLKISGEISQGFFPDASGKTDGYFDNAVLVDTLEYIKETELVEVDSGGLPWGWAAAAVSTAALIGYLCGAAHE